MNPINALVVIYIMGAPPAPVGGGDIGNGVAAAAAIVPDVDEVGAVADVGVACGSCSSAGLLTSLSSSSSSSSSKFIRCLHSERSLNSPLSLVGVRSKSNLSLRR